MKRLIFIFLIFLIFCGVVKAQQDYYSASDIYNNVFNTGTNSLRMIIGTGSSIDNDYGSISDILNAVFDSDSNALKIQLLGGVISDTSGFAYSTRYIVDENGDTVAQGLSGILGASKLFTPFVATDTLSAIGSTIFVPDSRKLGLGIVPISPLHVYENTGNVGSNTGLTVEQDGTGDVKVNLFLTGSQRWNFGIDNTDNYFKIDHSTILGTDPALTIAVNNNVGIGTATPAYKLEVNGNIKASRVFVDSVSHGIAGLQDSAVTIDLILDEWTTITNATGNLIGGKSPEDVDGFTASGDTSIALVSGYFVSFYTIGFSAVVNVNMEFRNYNITQARVTGYSSILSGRGNTVFMSAAFVTGDRVTTGDRFVSQVRNVSGNSDIIIRNMSLVTFKIME